MTGIQFTIGQNRLEKSFFHRMEMGGERKIICSEDDGTHYMILPLLDSGMIDCPWGRMSFDLERPDTSVFYLYVCATNEPVGKEIMMDEEKSLEEKIKFLASRKCLRFVNKQDVLLYEIEGRYLWVMLGAIGENVKISNMVVRAPGDNFMQTLPEVYREKNSFLHRYLSIFSSLYNDFQQTIDRREELLDPDKAPVPLLEMYLKWFGLDVRGGFIDEPIIRTLLKEVAWLMAHKGTKQCIERLCQIFIGEKPIILERSMMSSYLRKAEMEIYNALYGENPYDVTLLIETQVDLVKRRQLLHLIEQFKPVRCSIAVVFLENAGILDSYNYLDKNAYVFSSTVTDLDEEHLMDGTVVLQ